MSDTESPAPENLNTALEQFSCAVESVLYYGGNSATKKTFRDKNLVIAIEGEWGSGKSFFLDFFEKKIINQDQTKNIKNQDGSVKQVIMVKYNAWEDDYFDDPFVSLVEQFCSQIDVEPKTGLQDFKDTASIIIKTTLKIVAPKITEMHNALNSKSKKDVAETPNSYLSLKEKKEKFKKSLSALGGDSTLKVVIIDELDRCKPDYAVKVLEIVKHFFNVENVAFIMAIDKKQLMASIHKFYGNKCDAELYLARFFDFELKLPSNNNDFREKLVNHNFQKITLFKQEGNKLSFITDRYDCLKKLTQLFGMSPREQAIFSQRLNVLLDRDKLPEIPYYILIALHTKRATKVNNLIAKMRTKQNINADNIDTEFKEFKKSVSRIACIENTEWLETINSHLYQLFFRFILATKEDNAEKTVIRKTFFQYAKNKEIKNFSDPADGPCGPSLEDINPVLKLLCYL